MSTYALFEQAGVVAGSTSRRRPLRDWLRMSSSGVAAGAAWAAFRASCLLWQDVGDWSRTRALGVGAFAVAMAVLLGTIGTDRLGRLGRGLRRRAPWLTVLALWLALWEIATAKFARLPLPFFPPPRAIVEVYTDDLPKLLISVLASVKLQLGGYLIGAALGFVTGVAIGWSKAIGIRCCASSGHCRRPPGCRSPSSRFHRAGAPQPS